MICSGCGKDIPFAGAVCPYCQRDKRGDQRFTAITMAWGVIGILVGSVIGSLSSEKDGSVVPMFAGGFIGLVIGFIFALARNAGTQRTQPPEVRIARRSGRKDIARVGPDIASRLETLEALRSKGLISEAEFDAKRASILDEM